MLNRMNNSSDLVRFIGQNMPNDRNLRIQYAKNYSRATTNPDLIDLAISRAMKRSNFKVSLKHLMANRHERAIEIMHKRSPSGDWLHQEDTEMHPHGFWIGFNDHEDALDVIEKRLVTPRTSEYCDDGYDIWMTTLCSNSNPRAVRIIQEQLRKDDFDIANAVLKMGVHTQFPEQLHLGAFAANPSAANVVIEELGHYLMSDEHALLWDGFSKNPNPDAIKFMMKYPHRINLSSFTANPNPLAISLLAELESDRSNWDWKNLSSNPAAIEKLSDDLGRIDYGGLSSNPHPWAIRMCAVHFMTNPCDLDFRSLFGSNYRDAIYHQYVDFRIDAKQQSKLNGVIRHSRPRTGRSLSDMTRELNPSRRIAA